MSTTSSSGPNAARVGDGVLCFPHLLKDTKIDGPGCPSVFIEQRPAARKDDLTSCGGAVRSGATNVYVGGQKAARVVDRVDHGGLIIEGSATVLIGAAAPGHAVSRATAIAELQSAVQEGKDQLAGIPRVKSGRKDETKSLWEATLWALKDYVISKASRTDGVPGFAVRNALDKWEQEIEEAKARHREYLEQVAERDRKKRVIREALRKIEEALRRLQGG